ncbi:hypothetical protein SAZ10_05710 [Mesorhizobium sp. BAC0120]|uniref:hypothetical protein n=1 Tax=Mesorhizobium sp. BAC0120 TaxID=3090670 RepID=UPI00298CACED|nr:hypothetical protein [Mesorhizobium sp. BAC0120]MDW6021259.1 hypothetical protein [Mesorhizobium sp. BAC0120]
MASAARGRYKPETKFNKPEKFGKSHAAISVGRSPDGRRRLAPGMPMHRGLVDCGFAMLTAALIAASSAPSLTKDLITPAERCSRLSRQVDDAIKAKAADKQVAAVSVLQKRGVRLCAQDKRAQGIRSLAKALKLLGVKPIDID